jgi:hypothetical protein
MDYMTYEDNERDAANYEANAANDYHSELFAGMGDDLADDPQGDPADDEPWVAPVIEAAPVDEADDIPF